MEFAKNVYDDPWQVSSFIKEKIPVEYKEMVEKAESGAHIVTEMKKKKDEYHIEFLEKAIMPLIIVYDSN